MATALADIHVKVDPKVKKDAQKLYDQIGISMSDAINMMLKRSLLERRIPFDTFIPGDDAPECMKIKTKEELEAFIEKTLKENEESGITYFQKEIEEMFGVGRKATVSHGAIQGRV